MSEPGAKRPVFKPIRSRFTVAGLTAGAAIAVLAVFAAGAALAIALGSWTRPVEAAVPEAQRAEALAEYRSLSTQIDSIEKQRREAGATSYGELGLTAAQEKSLSLCEELGIRPGMGRFELEALVPATEVRQVEVLPFLARVLLLVLAPTGALYIALAEINRTTMAREAARAWRFARSQKEYRCAPREYAALAASGKGRR